MRYLLLILSFVILGCSTKKNQAEGAKKKEEVKINQLMNAWHQSAAVGDEVVFFGTYAKDNDVYIGTDPKELWTVKEFKAWSKPFFDKDQGWDFKTRERTIYFDESNPNVAWFDELLDTWMGGCRSSGVLTKIDGQWKLRHYHLSVAVPNEIIKKYIQLLPKEK